MVALQGDAASVIEGSSVLSVTPTLRRPLSVDAGRALVTLSCGSYLVLAAAAPVFGMVGVNRSALVAVTIVLLACSALYAASRGISVGAVVAASSVAGLLVWWATTLLWAKNTAQGVQVLSGLVYVVLPVALVILVRGNTLVWVVGIFSIAATATMVYAVSQDGVALESASRLAVGASNPSHLAARLGTAFIVAVFFLLHSRAWFSRVFWLTCALLPLGGIALTQGRNAIASLVVASVLTVVLFVLRRAFSHRQRRQSSSLTSTLRSTLRGALVIAVLLGASGVSLVVYGQQLGLERIGAVASGDPSVATAGRVGIWEEYRASLMRAPERWIHGHGVGSASTANVGPSRTPHNVWILQLTEAGLIGVALWFLVSAGPLLIGLSGVQSARSVFAFWVIAYAFFLGFGNDTSVYDYYWSALAVGHVIGFGHKRGELASSRHTAGSVGREG